MPEPNSSRSAWSILSVSDDDDLRHAPGSSTYQVSSAGAGIEGLVHVGTTPHSGGDVVESWAISGLASMCLDRVDGQARPGSKRTGFVVSSTTILARSSSRTGGIILAR
ncbi:hypothetical protein AcV7_005614 [Taiwanofungus camphoratus]|nr:hypothetical protein AcV7_005614 [Antrodia cinnamomea]